MAAKFLTDEGDVEDVFLVEALPVDVESLCAAAEVAQVRAVVAQQFVECVRHRVDRVVHELDLAVLLVLTAGQLLLTRALWQGLGLGQVEPKIRRLPTIEWKVDFWK